MDKKVENIQERDFEYTWCDYLTPCPEREEEDVCIGDYDCTQCKHFVSMSVERGLSGGIPPFDYSLYVDVGRGTVKCKCRD